MRRKYSGGKIQFSARLTEWMIKRLRSFKNEYTMSKIIETAVWDFLEKSKSDQCSLIVRYGISEYQRKRNERISNG